MYTNHSDRAARAAPQGSVPASYVRLLFEYLARQGHDAGAVLAPAMPTGAAGAHAGGANTGANAEAAYPAPQWRAMLERAADHLQDPALGLHIGATITAAHLGPLGYVLLSSSSVPAAIERYIRYQRLVHDISPVRCRQNDGQVVLEWDAESRSVGLLANQCGLAAVIQFARNVTGVPITPEAVHFVEPPPDDAMPYRDFFGCPVLFAQDATRIILPASLLSLPLRLADPALAAMLEQQVQAGFAALPTKDPFEQDVRQRISRHLLQGEPGLRHLAAELNTSGRTLRRHLSQHGWSYRALLDDTRKHLAEDYLRDRRLVLPEVALLLGYSEQSAFNRAFLRWFNLTPRHWRLRNAGPTSHSD
ncbi:AraC family transcriptional regulator [Rugamonas sp. DEMB1]|uniref:AraC family transcriptional regulator n=1 Tax=Rugamonas sp. DEMB1 TaxID=3039386 RepID=UPI00244AA141|nr:AraC family transcriptional regulator [Rugamonas sp. DEMB1]WGG52920.1 AraC family transcriptional regulator [Rugamonas sp. DEMB1]